MDQRLVPAVPCLARVNKTLNAAFVIRYLTPGCANHSAFRLPFVHTSPQIPSPSASRRVLSVLFGPVRSGPSGAGWIQTGARAATRSLDPPVHKSSMSPLKKRPKQTNPGPTRTKGPAVHSCKSRTKNVPQARWRVETVLHRMCNIHVLTERERRSAPPSCEIDNFTSASYSRGAPQPSKMPVSLPHLAYHRQVRRCAERSVFPTQSVFSFGETELSGAHASLPMLRGPLGPTVCPVAAFRVHYHAFSAQVGAMPRPARSDPVFSALCALFGPVHIRPAPPQSCTGPAINNTQPPKKSDAYRCTNHIQHLQAHTPA